MSVYVMTQKCEYHQKGNQAFCLFASFSNKYPPEKFNLAKQKTGFNVSSFPRECTFRPQQCFHKFILEYSAPRPLYSETHCCPVNNYVEKLM